jgi:putative holliday junction resolvase
MIYLGIDYGSKRVGVARADSELNIATPLTTLPNDTALLDSTLRLIEEGGAECVVIGESLDLKGAENVIALEAEDFAEDLRNATNAEIVFYDERYTTQQARRDAKGGSVVDASAAALILQSYLDSLS